MSHPCQSNQFMTDVDWLEMIDPLRRGPPVWDQLALCLPVTLLYWYIGSVNLSYRRRIGGI